MKIDHVFPIPIARFTVDESIIKNTTDLVNKYIVDSDLTNPPAPGEILTTFYNHKDFLGKLGDKALLNYINRAAREYIQLLGYNGFEAKNMYPDQGTDGRHPGPLSHRWFADEMIKGIKQL